jgi:hypothetical protein
VLRPHGKRSQDQKIQCPLWKINSFFAQIITPLTSTERQIHYSFVEVQGEIKEGSLETQCWPSGCVTDNSEISWSTGANRAMRSSSRIEGDLAIPVGSPTGHYTRFVVTSGGRSSIRNAGNTVVFHSKFSTTMRSFSDIRKAYFVDQTDLTVHAWVSLRAVDTCHGCGGYRGSGAGTSAFTSVLW